MDPCLLDLGTGWWRAVSFTSRPLYPKGRARGTYWVGGWLALIAGVDENIRIGETLIQRVTAQPPNGH
jgi:hypothetical protein